MLTTVSLKAPQSLRLGHSQLNMMEGGVGGDHFYVTLPSNSSEEFYGKQHPSNYHTRLDATIRLDPTQWEVGLAEVSYPKTWHNVPDTRLVIFAPNDVILRGKLRGRRYASGPHLIRELQDALDQMLGNDYKNKVTIEWDVVGRRAVLVRKPDYYVFLPHAVSIPLGFDIRYDGEATVMSEQMGIRIPRMHLNAHVSARTAGHYPVNVDRMLPTIYVYCDLVERQRVGDAYVQLLRTLNVSENVSGADVVTGRIEKVHYGAMSRGVFESVEIHVVDGHGDSVPFQHGDVIVKLHFRKKKK